MNLVTKTQRVLRKKLMSVALTGAVASLSLLTISGTPASATANPGFILYSAQGYDSAVVKAFNATHPGFTVTLNDNSTGPLLQQIQAEGNNPKWGALWVDGATAFAELDDQGMLVKNSVPTVNFNTLGAQNVPADKSFTPTGLTVTGALCYDSSQVSAASLPNTWQDLLSSKYKGLIGMNDPSQSGPTFPLIAGVMTHLGNYKSGSTTAAINAGEEYFTAAANNGLLVNATNGPTIGAIEAQNIEMATIQSSACYGHELTDFPSMRVKYLDYSVALPSVIGIDAKQPLIVRQDAQKFVAYVMSAAGQKVMQTGDPQGDSLFWPVLNGESPANAIIPSLASTHAITVNPYVWGPLETKINNWFDTNIANS